MARIKRIRPPYRAYAVSARGDRRAIEADSIEIELEPGVFVEVNLAPHPDFSGRLNVVTPPFSAMRDGVAHPELDVRFGASNIVHISVRRNEDSGPKTARR